MLPAGLKQGRARQAALDAGLPAATGCTTINKLCGSGMKATMLAHDLIKAGTNNIMVAGGMESMTNSPYILPKARAGYRMGHGEIKDHMFLDGLEDAKTGRLMGSFAQDMANTLNLTRGDMDAFAIESLKRAQAAIANGNFKAEIVAVPVTTRKGEVLIDTDEQPGNANADKIPTLKPAFAKDGSITAANASSISDGASALVPDAFEPLCLLPMDVVKFDAQFVHDEGGIARSSSDVNSVPSSITNHRGNLLDTHVM